MRAKLAQLAIDVLIAAVDVIHTVDLGGAAGGKARDDQGCRSPQIAGHDRGAAQRPAALYYRTGTFDFNVGSQAGHENTSGVHNAVVGYQAGYKNQTGTANAILGSWAGYGTASNSYSNDTMVGYQTGYGLTTGSNNVFLGYQTGNAVTTGGSNIEIGYNANVIPAGTSNMLYPVLYN